MADWTDYRNRGKLRPTDDDRRPSSTTMTTTTTSGRRSSFIRLLVASTVAFVGFGAQLLPSASGCIMLLDGWTPMTPGERAVLADIVAYGIVLRTFRDVDERQTSSASSSNQQRPPAADSDSLNTYTAEVKLVRVVKGRELVDAVGEQWRRPAEVGRNSSRTSRKGSHVVFYIYSF